MVAQHTASFLVVASAFLPMPLCSYIFVYLCAHVSIYLLHASVYLYISSTILYIKHLVQCSTHAPSPRPVAPTVHLPAVSTHRVDSGRSLCQNF
ncbi:hypothetical protein DAEQUDRAFT_13051 [Daedalea quercina L-15889]|uniref:Uncharacterized protein n=1 Tax=Daedalea quercina L-15889 TaxID=1314783 RepID=A0A165UHI9_9APHY|nr:hypothetical protein DAEQUDRAFT_13051 [Daedalea quercina L-15889]